MMQTTSPAAFILTAALLLLLSPLSLSVSYLRDTVDVLGPNQSLVLGSYSLLMEATCNLIFYDTEFPIWLSGTSYHGSGCYLKLNNDGKLIIHDRNGTQIWNNGVAGPSSQYILLMTHNRNAIVYGEPIWSAASGCHNADTGAANISQNKLIKGGGISKIPQTGTDLTENNHLMFGETLGSGKNLSLGPLTLVMQADCNLVLYDGKKHRKRHAWATHTKGKGKGCILSIEADGDLTIRDEANSTVWSSGCHGPIGHNHVLVLLLNPSSLVLYSRAWWSAIGSVV